MRNIVVGIIIAMCINVSADTNVIKNARLRTNEITKEEVRALYLMRTRRLYDGQVVVLFQMPANNPLHREFIRDVLGMSTESFNREQDKAINTGLGTYTVQVYSRDEMLARVSSTENGLGYLDKDYLIFNSNDKTIKVLHITN